MVWVVHPDEVFTDSALVSRLLATQFPQWAALPIKRVASSGTDNALYRLGDELVMRLPRVHWAVGQVEKEQQWLPKLAPHLSLAVPTPLAMGLPCAGYPWHWSVYRWLDGKNATLDSLSDPCQAAKTLAGFIRALQGCDATDGPAPGDHNSGRGEPLAKRDAAVRSALAKLNGRIDTDAATKAWETALQVPAWDNARVWLHGDLQSGNLLATDGQLSAVIDFGCLGVGDPACELIVGWNLFETDSRQVFRDALAIDDATWERGRGWALSMALIALPYYWDTNPSIVQVSLRTLDEVHVSCVGA
ncbi:aminoglycoside phosphotransferase family protein [Armatimonas sp.]|uniref:aminoglycoside phosphotransferase family protein n=1 Tax=Armatimonas sp. TaxID=1872638 RepID=UPI00286B698A|nr:aminoglycoside phosphotransferase family protein [Armatimonas sp.]